MTTRFATLFDCLPEGEGAYVPFIMLGDPSLEDSVAIARAAVAGGADALEIGVPYSDPVADGPAIQDSHVRGLEAGTTFERAMETLSRIREEFPELPISMLIYANLPFALGLERFYRLVAEASADAVLLPDLPVRESAPFTKAAEAAGVDPVFIAPPRASAETLAAIAGASRGYVYAISRDGVTGTERASETTGLDRTVGELREHGSAPALLGFGISTPEQVRAAIDAGAAGAITGSAITKLIAAHLVPRDGEDERGAHRFRDDAARTEALGEVEAFVVGMKAATRPE